MNDLEDQERVLAKLLGEDAARTMDFKEQRKVLMDEFCRDVFNDVLLPWQRELFLTSLRKRDESALGIASVIDQGDGRGNVKKNAMEILRTFETRLSQIESTVHARLYDSVNGPPEVLSKIAIERPAYLRPSLFLLYSNANEHKGISVVK